ncbi:hypothetical protein ACSQ67_016548 [Phaseolus vulgaris]
MGSSSKWVTLQLHCDCPPFSGFSLAEFRSSLKKHGCQFLDIISLDSWGYEPCSKHLLDQEDVDMVNALDKEKGITLEDFKLIKMNMTNYTDEKYRYEIKDILEMEMKILEALNYYLVVYHPYRSLSPLLQDAGLNDLNMTQLTCVLRDKDTTAWFEELRVDMNVVSVPRHVLFVPHAPYDFHSSPSSARVEMVPFCIATTFVHKHHLPFRVTHLLSTFIFFRLLVVLDIMLEVQ